MGQVTHEQGELMLQLYETRRESKLRDARKWYFSNFNPASFDDVVKHFTSPGEEGGYIRMVASYWDMVANYANRGLVDEEFLFETSGEQWIVWERLKPVIGQWREAFKNPHTFSALEEHVRRYEAWREKRAPGSNDHMRQVLARMRAGAAEAAKKSSAAS
jgi:hypothetical protein